MDIYGVLVPAVSTTGCYNCTAGTFQPGVVGNADTGTSCKKCPSTTLSTAKYSGPKASECSSTCPAGYGFVSANSVFNANEMTACTACVAGYYNDGSSIPCKQWYFQYHHHHLIIVPITLKLILLVQLERRVGLLRLNASMLISNVVQVNILQCTRIKACAMMLLLTTIV